MTESCRVLRFPGRRHLRAGRAVSAGELRADMRDYVTARLARDRRVIRAQLRRAWDQAWERLCEDWRRTHEEDADGYWRRTHEEDADG